MRRAEDTHGIWALDLHHPKFSTVVKLQSVYYSSAPFCIGKVASFLGT